MTSQPVSWDGLGGLRDENSGCVKKNNNKIVELLNLASGTQPDLIVEARLSNEVVCVRYRSQTRGVRAHAARQTAEQLANVDAAARQTVTVFLLIITSQQHSTHDVITSNVAAHCGSQQA